MIHFVLRSGELACFRARMEIKAIKNLHQYLQNEFCLTCKNTKIVHNLEMNNLLIVQSTDD